MPRTTLVGSLAALCLISAAPTWAQPANDDCASATVITSLPFADTVDTTTATVEAGDPTLLHYCDFGNRAAENGVWYRYTATTAINLELRTLGSGYDTIAVAFAGTCGAFTEIYCSDDDLNRNRNRGADGMDSRLLVTLAPGEDVYLLVADVEGPGGGNLVVDVGEAPLFQANHHDSAAASDDARFPSTAASPNGDFVVVWSNNYPAAIRGRLFDGQGRAKGASFDIFSGDSSIRPAVASLGGDQFVAVWSDYDLPSGDLRGQRFDATGGSVGGAFQINTTGVYGYPEVDADDEGNFVVSWLDGSDQVVARRFDADAAPQTAEIQVDSAFDRWPDVSVGPDGRFVVTWTDGNDLDGSNYGIFARRYDAAGNPEGPAFQVNTYTTGSQSYSTVAVAASGEFVVAWASGYEQNPDISRTIQGRLFDDGGSPITGEFQVNSGVLTPAYYGGYYGDDANTWPDADAGPNGFVVAWQRDYAGPYGRRLDAGGTPTGPEFQVADFWSPYQYEKPDVSIAPGGEFVVVWHLEYSCCTLQETFGRAFPATASGCPASPRSDCKLPTADSKGRLTMRDKSTDKGDSIVWKWVKGDETTAGDVGDPLATDGVTFCLYDGGGALLTDSTVDPGGTCGPNPCWKGLGMPPGATGFRYKNGESNATGAQTVVLKPNLQGKAKTIFKGHGEPLQMPTIPVTLPLTGQLTSSTGTCWSSEFRAEGVIKNEPGLFAGKANP